MTTKVEAIYEKGTLRPLRALSLPEGTRVDLVVKTHDDGAANQGKGEQRTPAEILAEIAALPVEGPRDGFSGADHDAVLYKKATR